MAERQTKNAVGETLHGRVLRQIRADIVACRLMPNERLTLEALRERYGVGWSPIREALMRLEADGLVAFEQNKGFRVAAVSRDMLADLMRSRMEIESTALRWSVENGSVAWEAELVASFHRLSRLSKFKRASSGSISPEWTSEHRAFHRALVAACGSPTMLGIQQSLFEQSERYVALSIISKAAPRNDVGEHEQIMQAALQRSVSRAVTLNREHIERTMSKVMRSIDSAAELTGWSEPARRAQSRIPAVV
jgi:GntR family transcriptional regulator, carbon starvation induced regulator